MNAIRLGRRPAVPNNLQRRHRPDYWLLLLSLTLLTIGLIVVYAISPGLSVQKGVSENYYVSKQLIAVLLGLVAFGVMAQVPLTLWRKLEKPIIIVAGIAALIVWVFGEQVNGATRWIQLGGFSFQAVELIKFALLIWLAGFLSERIRSGKLSDSQQTLKPFIIVMAIIGLLVGKLQSDLGSAGVMMGMMVAVAFIASMPLKRIGLIVGIIAIGTIFMIAGSSYRRDRLTTFLNPSQDCQSTGYQSCQALIAIGSGGMFGLGLARSVQAYGYLPEAANDSIFAIYAEKFGFVGVLVLLALFVAFFARLARILERTTDLYSRLIIAGILAWLSLQTIINIGAMIGLLPLKGITLPFISYGGTSIVFVAAVVGLAFQISRYTTYNATRNSQTEKRPYDNSVYRRRVRGAYHPTFDSRS